MRIKRDSVCTGCERCDPAMAARDEQEWEAFFRDVDREMAEEERSSASVSPWVQRALSGTLPAKVFA